MADVINLSDRRPKPRDPWEHAQPTLRTMHGADGGEREELWAHPYFGVSHMIWATGSHTTPEPPTPSGGSPVAANTHVWGQLRAAA